MSKKEFTLPQGRLQKVMCDVNYGKTTKFKVQDFFNQKTDKNPRCAKIEYDSLKGCKEAPYHQNDIKNFMRGQPEKKYKKEDVFEVGSKTKKCPKGKKICDCHLKQSKKKITKPIKQYKNEFHTLY